MGKAVTRKQIHEMLDLVLDINGMEARTRKETGDKPTAFMWFNGHVYDIDVYVYKNGWDSNACSPDLREIIKLGDDTSKKFDNIIELLKSIKNDRRHKAERSQTR